MDDSAPSPSTDGLVHVICVIHHRTGGYLCRAPTSKGGESPAAVAFDRDIIPYQKYILRSKGGTSVPATGGRRPARTRSDFYHALDRLLGTDVSVQDDETHAYLTAGRGRYGKPSAKFQGHAQFFRLGRHRETGAYSLRLSGPHRQQDLLLHKSSKTRSWAMKCARGPNANVEIDIDTSNVNFSVDEEAGASEWILEPDETAFVLDALPTDKEQHRVLFLGIVDINSAQRLVAYHFWNVPAAWRSTEEWERAMDGMKHQHVRGNDYCTHVGNKTKWMARPAQGKMCLVIASTKFHYQPLEDCVDRMAEMLGRGPPAADELRELGSHIQTKEETARNKVLENEAVTAVPIFQHMKDVPISLLHRSGGWFSLQTNGCTPDLLYLEPCPEDQGEDSNATDEIKSTGDYFQRLKAFPKFAIASSSSRPTAKCYLVSRERKNPFVKEKQRLFRKKYLAAEFAALTPGERPETFALTQNPEQGGISIASTSNGCFLSRNRRGHFVFTENEHRTVPSDAAEKTCAAHEEHGAWFIDAPDLHGVASEGLLFAGIVSNRDKRARVSSHAPGRPTAWRTTDSWDYITDELWENVRGQSSTFVIDWDTGHKWFATNPDGKELFIVIATEGFPLYYGTATLVAMEHLHQTLEKDEQRLPSSSEVQRVMRDVETEYRYELCFGNDEVLGLIEDVEELTDKMMENIDGLKENIATEQEILEKADQLHVLAQQFKRKSSKKKWRVAATAVAGGAVVGGLIGLAVGCPVGLIVLETQAAEVALGAAVGAAPGCMKGIALLSTDAFWKRKFVNLGKCIDSRRRKRSRDKTQMDLDRRRADNIKQYELI